MEKDKRDSTNEKNFERLSEKPEVYKPSSDPKTLSDLKAQIESQYTDKEKRDMIKDWMSKDNKSGGSGK